MRCVDSETDVSELPMQYGLLLIPFPNGAFLLKSNLECNWGNNSTAVHNPHGFTRSYIKTLQIYG